MFFSYPEETKVLFILMAVNRAGGVSTDLVGLRGKMEIRFSLDDSDCLPTRSVKEFNRSLCIKSRVLLRQGRVIVHRVREIFHLLKSGEGQDF